MIKKPKQFKSENKALTEEVNLLMDALYGQALATIGWQKLLDVFIKKLSPQEKEEVRNYMFPVLNTLEDDLDETMNDLTLDEILLPIESSETHSE